MRVMPISTGREKLFNLAQSVIESHEPVTLTGKKGNVVLLSEEDFRSIQETLYLYSIPGLLEDVKEGRETPENELGSRDDLPW